MKKVRLAAFLTAGMVLSTSLGSVIRPVRVSAASITDLQQQAENLLNQELDRAGETDNGSENVSGSSSGGTGTAVSSADETSDSGSTDDTASDDAVNIAETSVEHYQTVEINNRQDFAEVVRNCHFDNWSTDKQIVLNADIDFENEEFEPLESFGGIFQGNGHTLNRVSIAGNVDGTGVFGTIRRSGRVIGLHVEGVIDPDGLQSELGGIAGYNYGTIENCSFNGRIDADKELGGIAGRNGRYGVISGCTSSGAENGTSACGGIAGYNEGTIDGCTNDMEVNTTYQDTGVTVDQLTNTVDNIVQSGQLFNSENLDVNGDTGGIAGFSSGVITSCVNNAEIGYEHVGYNIGGIAGRSSGFLRNNINNGEVKGRKDVGGIVGQMQPYLAVDFAEDALDSLDGQLDELNQLVNTGLNNADGYSSNTLNHLQNINGLAGIARDSAKSMADESADQVDEAADKINTATGTLQNSLSTFSDISSRLGSFLQNVKDAANGVSSSFTSYLDGLDISDTDKEQIKNYWKDFLDGLDEASEGLEDLTTVLRGPEIEDEAVLTQIRQDLDQIRDGYSKMKTAVDNMYRVLDSYSGTDGSSVTDSDLYQQVKNAKDILDGETYDGITDAVNTVNDHISNNDLHTGDLTAVTTLVDTMQASLDGALNPDQDKEDIRQSLRDAGVSDTDADTFISAWNNYLSARTDVQNANSDLKELHNDEIWSSPQITIDEESGAIGLTDGSTARTTYERYAVEKVQPAVVNLMKALNSERESLQQMLSSMSAVLDPYLENAGNFSGIQSALDRLRDTLNNYPDISGDLSGALDSLASLDLQMNGISDSLRNNGNNLYSSISQLQSEMDALNAAMSSESDQGIDNLRAITAQFDAIMHTLEDAAEDLKNPGGDSSIEDVSDENIQGVFQGRATSCSNNGEIHADTNVGGITGMIGVEYDLDPDSDIQTTGNTSLDYIFRARCIVDSCTNNSLVAARSSYSGGIAGQMEMGLVADSQNYGNLDSSGNYTGGISGYTTGLLRNNASKCDLSGAKYVGGIAGYGVNLHDNYAMVNITECDQYEGAVAGKVRDINADDVYENYYYSTVIYGINSVSYAGIAEGVSYEELVEKSRGNRGDGTEDGSGLQNVSDTGGSAYDTESSGSGGANRFEQLVLTFKADDDVVGVVEVNYGASVPADQIPEVPEKDGFHGKWSRTDYSRITADETITAEYSRINTLLSSSQTRSSGLAIVEVYGDFQEDDELLLTGLSAEEGETERWIAAIPDDGLSVHEIRYLAPDESTDVKIYVIQNGEKTEVPTSTLGKYVTFESDGSAPSDEADAADSSSSGSMDSGSVDVSSVIEPISDGTGVTNVIFAVEETDEENQMIPVLAGTAGGAAVLLLTVHHVRKRRKKRHHAGNGNRQPQPGNTDGNPHHDERNRHRGSLSPDGMEWLDE